MYKWSILCRCREASIDSWQAVSNIAAVRRRFTQTVGGYLAKKKRERKKVMTKTNCSQGGSVTSECSVPYLCSFWILQKTARSSTDVCLRSSQGEIDLGRIFLDPESILFSGAGVRLYRYVSASRNDVITCWNKEHTADSTVSTRDLSH